VIEEKWKVEKRCYSLKVAEIEKTWGSLRDKSEETALGTKLTEYTMELRRLGNPAEPLVPFLSEAVFAEVEELLMVEEERMWGKVRTLSAEEELEKQQWFIMRARLKGKGGA